MKKCDDLKMNVSNNNNDNNNDQIVEKDKVIVSKVERVVKLRKKCNRIDECSDKICMKRGNKDAQMM